MTDSDDYRVPETEQLYFGPTVAITVSEGDTHGRVYHIHRNLIEARLPFVRKERKSPDKSQKRSFSLHYCNLKAFEVYCHYIYTNRIPCVVESKDEEGVEWETLVNLFLLSERLDDAEATDAALNALLHAYQNNGEFLPPSSVVSLVYKKTASGSPLRRLLVDIFRWGATEQTIEDEQEELPTMFYADLTKSLLREKAEELPDIPSSVSCYDYHVHDANAECPSRKRKRGDSDDNDDESGEDDVGSAEETDEEEGERKSEDD